MKNENLNVPQRGAWRRLSERLKEIGSRPPPKSWLEILNQTEEPKIDKKRVARSLETESDLGTP